MWQTILNFTTFNHLPGTVYHDETAGSQVWDNNARNRTVAVYEHPIPKSTAWVDCFHALSFSCLDSFLDGWFQICAYYVNVPSLKMWWCSFIFCGWKIKSKPRIGRQETLEDPLCLTIKHGSCPPACFFSHQTTGQPAPFLGCSPRTLTHSRLNTPPVQTQGMLSLERLDENCMPKICTLPMGTEYDTRWDLPFCRNFHCCWLVVSWIEFPTLGWLSSSGWNYEAP